MKWALFTRYLSNPPIRLAINLVGDFGVQGGFAKTYGLDARKDLSVDAASIGRLLLYDQMIHHTTRFECYDTDDTNCGCYVARQFFVKIIIYGRPFSDVVTDWLVLERIAN